MVAVTGTVAMPGLVQLNVFDVPVVSESEPATSSSNHVSVTSALPPLRRRRR
jgi:hypothetical protein